jgi:hypothetical protein
MVIQKRRLSLGHDRAANLVKEFFNFQFFEKCPPTITAKEIVEKFHSIPLPDVIKSELESWVPKHAEVDAANSNVSICRGDEEEVDEVEEFLPEYTSDLNENDDSDFSFGDSQNQVSSKRRKINNDEVVAGLYRGYS